MGGEARSFVPAPRVFFKLERKSGGGGGERLTQVIGGQGLAEFTWQKFNASFVPGTVESLAEVGCVRVTKVANAIVQ